MKKKCGVPLETFTRSLSRACNLAGLERGAGSVCPPPLLNDLRPHVLNVGRVPSRVEAKPACYKAPCHMLMRTGSSSHQT